MEAKLIGLLIVIFLAVANALPVDDNRDEVYIPSLIKNIYDKMSAVLDQDDRGISLNYQRIVKTLHWLKPVTFGKKHLYISVYCYVQFQYTAI